jgi:7-carboxy-7-deazaguanine synthase
MTVLLETSGSLPLDRVDPRVVRIIDMKTPTSGEVLANDYSLLSALRPHDEVKFVIGGREDYEWAKEVVRKHQLTGQCAILFGPVFGVLAPEDLVAWVLRDTLEVRVQVQLHKYIWDPKTQGV